MQKGISEVDPVLDALGGNGRYQWMQFFLVQLSGLSSTFQLLNIVFVGRSIPHTCSRPDNISEIFDVLNNDQFSVNSSIVEFEQCKIRVASNISGIVKTTSLDCIYGHSYKEGKELSIISDMDVVCDKAGLKGLGQTLLIVGQGFGAFIFPIFSDRYGRRPVHLTAHFVMLALGIGVAFSPTYLVFLILRILVGACQQGTVMSRTTITIEVFPARHRKITALLMGISLSCASMLIALIAYLTRDISWRYSQLSFCCLIFYVFVQFLISAEAESIRRQRQNQDEKNMNGSLTNSDDTRCSRKGLVDESLRWLMANGKHKQITKVLKKAARISGKSVREVFNVYNGLKEKYEGKSDLTESLVDSMEAMKQDQNSTKDKHQSKPSLLDLLKRKRLALNVAVLWFIWFTDSMTFFGLYMTSHALVGSRYVNFCLLALVKSPAAFVNFFMVDRYGRKKTSIFLHGIAGSGLLLATIIKHVGHGYNWAETAVTVFSLFGMFGIYGGWVTSFFMTPEMFPTNLRNVGLGTSSSFSRIGGMLAPFASLLAQYVSWAPGAIFGGCCVIATVVVNILPETMGRELPQTLHDLELWYEKQPDEKDGSAQEIRMDPHNRMQNAE